MTKLSSYIIVLILLTSCVTAQRQKASIYGVSNLQTNYVDGWYQYRYVVYFSPNIEKYSISYYVGEDRLYTYSDDIPRTRAKNSIGLSQYFETSQKVPVIVRIRGYVRTGSNEYDTLLYVFKIGD